MDFWFAFTWVHAYIASFKVIQRCSWTKSSGQDCFVAFGFYLRHWFCYKGAMVPWKGDNRFFAPNFVDWSPAMLFKAIVLKSIAGHMKPRNKSPFPCWTAVSPMSHPGAGKNLEAQAGWGRALGQGLHWQLFKLNASTHLDLHATGERSAHCTLGVWYHVW